MKSVIIIFSLLLAPLASAQHAGHTKSTTAATAHKTTATDQSEVKLEYKGPTTLKAGAQSLSFALKAEKVLRSSDLETLHEKKLHVIIYDDALNTFFHVHPTEKDGLWTTEPIHFTDNGKYFFWVEGKRAGAAHEFNKFIKLSITEGEHGRSAATILKPTLSASSGNSLVKLQTAELVAKKEVMPLLVFSRNDKTTPQLIPYLGALAHVIVVPLQGDKLIHVHPMQGSKPNELMIHTTFPAKGDYRIWVQFIDGGELKTVPLAVNVK